MSYTVASPGGKTRPGIVTVACWLLFGVAAIELFSLAISVTTIGPMLSAVEDVYADKPEAGQVGPVLMATAIGGAVLSGLVAIGMIVLGLLMRGGKNPARIVTFVLAGIVVLCNVCGYGAAALTSSMGSAATADADAEELTRRLDNLTPAWQGPVTTVTGIVVLAALIAAIILLALPASNEFFRKEQEVWVPPTMPGGSSGGLPPIQPVPGIPQNPPAVPSQVDTPPTIPPTAAPTASPTDPPTTPPQG